MSEFEQYNAGTHPIVKLVDDWNNLLDHGLMKEPDAVIYISGALVKAVSGSTGKVISSDADLSVVVSACFTAGAIWTHIKAGTYATWNTVVSNIPAYGRLTGSSMDGVNITASAVMADAMIKLLNTGCRVEDLTLDCDGKFNYGVSIQGPTCECIEVQTLDAAVTGIIFNGAGVTGSKLKWCKAKRSGVIGCDILNTNTDIWVMGCTFSVDTYAINNSVGLRINASGVQVTDPHIWGCDDGVVLADVSSIENLTLKGGYIESNVRHNMKWGQHSVRACYVESVFWTNSACNTMRTTRVAELGGEVFCDIYTDTPSPNPLAYRQERNTINCIFSGNSKQSYGIYRNTYYFQFNNLSGSKFRTTYLISELGETTPAAANWNIVVDPDLEPEIATVQTTHYWSDPILPGIIGRHEGKLAFMYNSHMEEYRLGAYINGDWRHANLTDMPTGVVNVPIGGIIMWSGLKSDIPDGWGLCDGDDASLVVDTGVTTGNFTVFGINVGITSTLTNGTGTATGSVITLVEGLNTIVVTGAGTFTIALRDGATARVVSGTATIVSSPVRTFKTPDLRGLFAKSITAGEPGSTGGSTTYSHSGTTATTTPNLQGAGAGNVVTAVDVTIDDHTGVQPPFYTLAYIMRIR